MLSAARAACIGVAGAFLALAPALPSAGAALVAQASASNFPAAPPQDARASDVSPVAAPVADPFEGFAAVVEAAMEEWKVPGLAVAAVHNGKLAISKGFGYRNLEEREPVTPRTLFAIGSNTKSFTATVLGMLVDEGKLEWNRPVLEYIPEFRMHDHEATRGMTAEDLLTHRSGLPRHDLLWYGSDFTREEMVERLRFLEPSKPFRAEWQYQNLMFMTAGYLAGRLVGRSWERLVEERVLTPLGMERSNFSTDDLPGTNDFARPYAIRDSQVVRIPYRNVDAVGPAGSINSSAEEMVRYIQFHLDRGKIGEQRLLSEANAMAMQSPQMAMRGDRLDPELGHSSYGLGLAISSYRGRKLVRHGGGIDGFISSMAWLPDDSIGVIVLSNLSGNNPVPGIVTWNVMDRLLGLEEVDWVSRVRERQAKEEAAESEEGNERVEGTSPTHALGDYAGRYEHPAYGVFEIHSNQSGLTFAYNDFRGSLEHWHYDLFRVATEEGNPLSETKLLFQYDKKGDIDRVSVTLEPNVSDIVFERAADEAMHDPSFLSRLTGEYELGARTLVVMLRGGQLALTVTGQPKYDLVPDRGTSFDLEGLPGSRVEFSLPESGPATEAILHQPNGTFTATRRQ